MSQRMVSMRVLIKQCAKAMHTMKILFGKTYAHTAGRALRYVEARTENTSKKRSSYFKITKRYRMWHWIQGSAFTTYEHDRTACIR